jgi:hypothetical protein
VLQIVKDGFTHFILKGKLLDATTFSSMDAESFVPPVKVVEAKARHLTGP